MNRSQPKPCRACHDEREYGQSIWLHTCGKRGIRSSGEFLVLDDEQFRETYEEVK